MKLLTPSGFVVKPVFRARHYCT